MIRKKLLKRGLTVSLSAFVAMSAIPVSSATALAADAKTSWADLYSGMGVTTSTEAGYYDTVTSATEFIGYHVKDIPAVVNRVKDDGGAITGLDGVNLTGKEAAVTPKLASASFTAGAKYGSYEFAVIPDDTVEGYVWNDYIANLYAVTISDGTTTVGALPWVDFYGEAATSGPHYNKVEVALNSGTSVGSNQATVHRFDAFYKEDGTFKPGIYTVTCYAEGFAPLTAVITTGTISVADTTVQAESIEVKAGADLGFTPNYQLDGKDVTAADGKITVSGLSVGSHTLTASDPEGKIAAVSTTFLATTDQPAAAPNENGSAIVPAEGVEKSTFDAYISGITSVSVNGKAYNTSGRGAVKLMQPDGSLDLTKDALNLPAANIVVKSTGYPDLTFAYKEKVEKMVLMNVPYSAFYETCQVTDAAVWEVEEGIDAVSTATTSKYQGTGASGMAQGTYNDGTYIRGVQIPVAMDADTYAKLKTGLDEHADYAFTDTTVDQKAYMKLTIAEDGTYRFRKLPDSDVTTEYLSVGQVTDSKFYRGEVKLTGGYGDYEIAIGGLSNPNHGVQISETEYETCTIYGAIVNTTEGKSYGMTALENLWFGSRYPYVEIAWSIPGGQGLKRGHGNGGEFYQFEGMNGATLDSVDVLTSIGVIHVSADNLKLPEYYTGDLSGLSYAVTAGSNELAVSGIPEDLKDVKVSLTRKNGRNLVYLAQDAAVADGKVALTVESDNYQDISTKLTAEAMDTTAVDQVNAAISALPAEAKATDEETVKAAREAYDALTDVQKAYVTADILAILTKAEEAVAADQAAIAEAEKAAKEAADLTTADISGLSDKVYTGKALTPAPVVKKGGTILTAGKDYTVKYANNINAGTATVTVTGTGAYTGSAKASFTIKKAASAIKLTKKTTGYTGKAISIGKAAVKGSNGKITCKYYSDKACRKEVKAANVKNAGTYYVKATVAANANYSARTSAAVTLVIKKAAQPLKVKAVARPASFKALKKKAVVVSGGIRITTKAQGMVTYAKVAKGSDAKLSINAKTGKITVKKGTAKGRHKIIVNVKAAGNANYLAGTRKVTVTITVK